MRYLSKFNENSSLYSEINSTQYRKLIDKYQPDDFTKYEKSRMIEEFNRLEKRNHIEYRIGDSSTYREPKSLYEMENILPGNKVILKFGGRIFGKEINIVKIDEGWYMLDIIPRDAHTFATRNNRSYESYRKYYKCDQFDGVLNFLNDNLRELSKLK